MSNGEAEKSRSRGDPLPPVREQCAADLAATLVALTERSALHASDLSRSTLRALGAVQESTRISLMNLSRSLGMAPAAVSRLCGRLEGAGLLVRRPDGEDRRRISIELTLEGQSRLRAHRAQHVRHILTLLDLPEEGAADLERALMSLRDELLRRLHAAQPP